VIRTPVQAPNANAFAERWVRTVRADCLDRVLIVGRRHLEHLLRGYRRHHNEHRPHRALQLLPPNGPRPTGELTVYKDFVNPLNRRISAAAVYAHGAPAITYQWDFDNDGVTDFTTSSALVVHAYGIPIGHGPDKVTTTVRIQHIDGTETVRTVFINRALKRPRRMLNLRDQRSGMTRHHAE
jgi:Integrase core domain